MSSNVLINIEEENIPTQDSTIDIEDDKPEIEEAEEENPFQKKKRKKTSTVWNEFSVVNDHTTQCQYCKTNLAITQGGPTTTLHRHLKRCSIRQLADKKQKKLAVNTTPSKPLECVENFVYDHAKVREVAVHMVLIHEYSFNHMEHEMFNIFLRTVSPHWQKISRARVKQDCISTYEIEKKKKLKALFKTMRRISITTDLWKSGQDIKYMVVTGHFIVNWVLHKRILNFVHVPPLISGVFLYDALYKCFIEWGIEDKVATITVDNASYNDSAVRILKENFALKKNLFLGGKLFHVRCTAHIMNLLVQDGLKEIHHVIENVRKSVKYLCLSEACLIKFSEIAKQLELPSKKLILDCPTRWNSTYAMLAAALEFKEVFPRYATRDHCYDYLLSSEDWEKAESVCEFLGVFNEVTSIISGSDYPTSNLFLSEVWRVKKVLNKNLLDERPYIIAIALQMNEKFEKYWGGCNLLMAVGSILDPRDKMVLIEYCFKEIYPEFEVSNNIAMVKEALYELYNEYVANHIGNRESSIGEATQGSQSCSSTNSSKKSIVSGRAMYHNYVKGMDRAQPEQSDLDVYLGESVFICEDDSDSHFDALGWWKANKLKYRILSKMATVASNSAFSAGGRVIDTYHATLSTDIVQVLMCGADWAHNLCGIKKILKGGSNDNKGSGIQEMNLP